MPIPGVALRHLPFRPLHQRRPSLERRGDLALAFAELLLVGAAHERSLDVAVVAVPQLRRCALAQAVPGDDAMPLGFRGPFVVGILPRPLRRDGKNGELRTVIVPRLTLPRVCADEAHDRY